MKVWDAAVIPLQSGPSASSELRRLFGSHPSGVTAVCAKIAGRNHGLTASSFTSVSLNPPLVSICIDHNSTTWPVLRTSEAFGLSFLAEDQTGISRQLSSRGGDKFADIECHQTGSDALYVKGAVGWIECELFDELPAGDHQIVLFRIHAYQIFDSRAPLIFHQSNYRSLAQPT